MPDASANERALPFDLSHYHVERLLGRGAMGEVYFARDRRDSQPAAIKLLNPLIANVPGYRQRFEHEAHLGALLRSPYTVHLLDYGVEDGACFLVMEYIDGAPLSDLIRSGPLPPARALTIAADVARALEEAQARGVVHRDIKPENILVAGDRVKTADFGIARAESGPAVTPVGQFVGTPAYAAPEQARGEFDIRSDIYALGATLYAMLTGTAPFRAATAAALLEQHRTASLPSGPLAAFPDAVGNLVRRCMEKDPRDRYQSASELGAALQRAIAALISPAAAAGPAFDPGATVVAPVPAELRSVPAPRRGSSPPPIPPPVAPRVATPARPPATSPSFDPVAAPPARNRGWTTYRLAAAGGIGLVAVLAIVILIAVVFSGGDDKSTANPSPTGSVTANTPGGTPGAATASPVPGSASPNGPASSASAAAAPPNAIVPGQWQYHFTVLSNNCPDNDPPVGKTFDDTYIFEESDAARDGYLRAGEAVRTSAGLDYVGDFPFTYPNFQFSYPFDGGHAVLSTTFSSANDAVASLTETYDLANNTTCSVELNDAG